jgi:RHS repeat-associated protein
VPTVVSGALEGQKHASAFFGPPGNSRRSHIGDGRGLRCRSGRVRVRPRPRTRDRGGVFLNNRYHDPTTGTFLSVDPLVARTGQAYLYGAGNPVTFSDPSGLDPCSRNGTCLGEYLDAKEIAKYNESRDQKTRAKCNWHCANRRGEIGNGFRQALPSADLYSEPCLSCAVGGLAIAATAAAVVAGAFVAADAAVGCTAAWFLCKIAIGSVGTTVGQIANDAANGAPTGIQGVVVSEASSIYGSRAMARLRAAFAAGEAAEVNVAGRAVLFEPGFPYSGMTLFEEGGFVLGPAAFQSEEELARTLLHELYRLNTSAAAGGVSGGLARAETDAAFDFAKANYQRVVGAG